MRTATIVTFDSAWLALISWSGVFVTSGPAVEFVSSNPDLVLLDFLRTAGQPARRQRDSD